MSQTIKVLCEQTANQIAAGEVVVRPASVIKELIENSIDAGSSRIEIKVVEGGLKRIQVTDNGLGMSGSDCEVAFLRHATSKIADTADLFKINTLGFRGEALPSIASVSKIKLTSRQASVLVGTRVLLVGGKLIETSAIGCPVGTDILVEDLFFNVPARKKYIKKHSTEAYQSIDIVQKMAIAYPNISFQLWHNGQLLFTTTGSGETKDVLAIIYGLEYIEKTIIFEYKTREVKVSGVIGKSFFHRSNRERQIFIVNGRIIKNNLMQTTLENVYQGKLPVKRYPIGVINLNLPAKAVDVNVHPAKQEVTFAYSDEIAQILTFALTEGLASKPHIPRLVENKRDKYEIREEIKENVLEAGDNYLQTELKTNLIFSEETLSSPLLPNQNLRDIKISLAYEKQIPEQKQIENETNEHKTSDFPVLKAVGQVFNSFIVAEGNDALYIIDQHGAHERINYEVLYEKFKKQNIVTQGIAIPALLKLNPIESKLLIENIVLLTDFGIVIEHFGDNDFLIRAVPYNIDADEAAELVQELIQNVREEKFISQNFLADRVLKSMACKQAVKAKNQLSLAEQQELLDTLSLANSPYTCPHGRSIITSLNSKELRRRFDRN